MNPDDPRTPPGTAEPGTPSDASEPAGAAEHRPQEEPGGSPAEPGGTRELHEATDRDERAAAANVATAERFEPPRPRVTTVAFGAVLLALSISVAAAEATELDVDFGVVAIAMMIGIGLLFLVGARRN